MGRSIKDGGEQAEHPDMDHFASKFTKALSIGDTHGAIRIVSVLEYPWDRHWCVLNAASSSNLEFLRIYFPLHKISEMHEASLITSAVQSGDTDCVKYFRDQGVPWMGRGSWVCNPFVYAARNGDLPMIRYLHENGCPMTDLVITYATEGRFQDCLEYAIAHGFQAPWEPREHGFPEPPEEGEAHMVFFS